MPPGAIVCKICLRQYSAVPSIGSAVDRPELHPVSLRELKGTTLDTTLREYTKEHDLPLISNKFLNLIPSDEREDILQWLGENTLAAQVFRWTLGGALDVIRQKKGPKDTYELITRKESGSLHKTQEIGLRSVPNPSKELVIYVKLLKQQQAAIESLTNQVLTQLEIPHVEVLQERLPSGEIINASPEFPNVVELRYIKILESGRTRSERTEMFATLRRNYGRNIATFLWLGKGDTIHNQMVDQDDFTLVVLDHENVNPPFEWLNHPKYLTKENIEQAYMESWKKEEYKKNFRLLGVLHRGKPMKALRQGFQEGLQQIRAKLQTTPNELAPLIHQKIELAPAVQWHEAFLTLAYQCPELRTIEPPVRHQRGFASDKLNNWKGIIRQVDPSVSNLLKESPWNFSFSQIDEGLQEISDRLVGIISRRSRNNLPNQVYHLTQDLKNSAKRWKILLTDPDLIQLLVDRGIVWSSEYPKGGEKFDAPI